MPAWRQKWIARFNDEQAARAAARQQIKIISGAAIKPILEAISTPAFDPQTATPEEWTEFNAALSEEQRVARRINWVQRVQGKFAKQFPLGQRSAARRLAADSANKIYAAFDMGKSRDDVIKMLDALYNCTAQHQTQPDPGQKNGPEMGPVK